jgi:hypothetical protein
MNKKIDLFLTIATISFLFFFLIAELGNLIGFGTQEFYLNHPDYPEGENFNQAIENGKLELTLWTILTIALLGTILYSKVKKDQKLFNGTALATFLASIYIPFLAFSKGMNTTGFGILAAIIVFIVVIIFQIRREKALAITSASHHGG